MITIKDARQQLNYHPQVIYFLLDTVDFEKYQSAIKELNNHRIFTRGIFQFEAIERGTEPSHLLSDELVSSLSRHNIIVRLLDDAEGNFNYVMVHISLTKEADVFEADLQCFITDVCNRNIKFIDELRALISQDSETDPDYLIQLNNLRLGFQDAAEVKLQLMQRTWYRILHPSNRRRPPRSYQSARPLRSEESHFTFGMITNMPREVQMARQFVDEALQTPEAKAHFKTIMAYLESCMNVPTVDESTLYAQGTIDDEKSGALALDHSARTSSASRPHITIVVSKVPSKQLKNSTKKVWGVEITVDGTTIPVYMGSTSATMVYISTLLKKKMNTHLMRDSFKKNVSNSPITKRHADVLWLAGVYEQLFPGISEGFDTWYNKSKQNSCHAISQGKGHANRSIMTYVGSDFPEAVRYCQLQTKDEKNKNCYFDIDVPAKDIILPEEFEHQSFME